MIVVVGRVRTDAARRADFVRCGEALVTASRGDRGCLAYGLHQATDDEDAFVFVEEWEDEEALREHFASPHIATFMRDVRGLLAAMPAVRFHTVEHSRDIAEMRDG